MILACLMSVDSLRLININRAYEKTLYFKLIVAVFTSFIMLMSSDGHLKRISLKDLLFLSQFYSILQICACLCSGFQLFSYSPLLLY